MTREEAIKSFDEENGIKKYIASLNKNHPSYKDYLKIIERNEMAISVLKGGWIPIESEEKPEEYDRVLITINGCRGSIVREARYNKTQNEFKVLYNNERWEVGEKGLLAWQPLPEPYKKGE